MSPDPRAAGVAPAAAAKPRRDYILACACAAWVALCYAVFFLMLPRVPGLVGEGFAWTVLVMLCAPFVALIGLTASVAGLWLRQGNRRFLLIALAVNAAGAMPIFVSGFRYQLSRIF